MNVNLRTAKALLLSGLALLLCLAAAPSAEAATLRLISLTCHHPEDSEVDECELKVRGEGHHESFGRHMRIGQTWMVNRSIRFCDQVTVSLYDRDSGPFDRDDRLGSVQVNSAPVRSRTVTFNRDGAHYTLRYAVER